MRDDSPDHLILPSSGGAYDVVVVGAGAMGGWTALNLSRQGKRVALVDAWGPGNSRSSSGDETRVIRCMYGRDTIYVDLVMRAFEMWRAFEREHDCPLMQKTGALWMCSGPDDYVTTSIPYLEQNGLVVETLTVANASARYPQIDFAGVQSVFFEQEAALLSARQACVDVARACMEAGCIFLTGHVSVPVHRDSVVDHVVLNGTARLVAEQFVFCCGPWLVGLFPDTVGNAITVTRQDVFYLGVPPGDESFSPQRFPVWIDLDERIMYGVPDTGGRGFKIGDDTRGEPFDPTTGERVAKAESLRRVRQYVDRRFPRLRGAPVLEARVCQYANSPDGHLVIGRVPGFENVWLAGGGSGHAFKLGPALGEYVADRIVNGGAVSPTFAIDRLRASAERKTQWR